MVSIGLLVFSVQLLGFSRATVQYVLQHLSLRAFVLHSLRQI